MLHYILVFIVKIERMIRHQKIIIVNKDALRVIKGIKTPIIFASTHCGKFDIQVLTEVLHQYHWSLLSGDPMFLPGTIEGYWLKLNGVIYVDRDVKELRHKAKADMIRHLQNGKNIMIYPEGTWNFSPNLPVLPLFRGVADIAKQTNATIVPFALEIDDAQNTYYVKIGTPIMPTSDSLLTLSVLRNQMAEMKWTLIEELTYCRQKYIKEKLYANWDKYIKLRLSECSYMSFDLIWKYSYKEIWQKDYEQINSILSGIFPTKQNAFLFNKRLK